MGKEYTRALTTLGIIPVAGQIILHDDFEGILKWTKFLGTGDSIFELDPTIAKRGSQSFHMKTRTTNAAGGDIIQTNLLTHLLPSGIMTFISAFRPPSKTPMEYTHFEFAFDNGINAYNATIELRPNIPDWRYQTTAAAYVTIDNSDFNLAPNAWHSIILKVNFNTYKYISLYIDNHIFSLADLPLYVYGTSGYISLTPKVTIETAGAAPTELYLDEIILHEL